MQTVSVSTASLPGARRDDGGPRWILDFVTDGHASVGTFAVRTDLSVRSVPGRADGVPGAPSGA